MRGGHPLALWAGVTCEALRGSVVGLVLSNMPTNSLAEGADSKQDL